MSRESGVEDNNRYQVYSFPFRESNSLEQRRSFCLQWGTSQGVTIELRLIQGLKTQGNTVPFVFSDVTPSALPAHTSET